MEVQELENAQLRERARAALGRYFLQAVSVSFIARFFWPPDMWRTPGMQRSTGP